MWISSAQLHFACPPTKTDIPNPRVLPVDSSKWMDYRTTLITVSQSLLLRWIHPLHKTYVRNSADLTIFNLNGYCLRRAQTCWISNEGSGVWEAEMMQWEGPVQPTWHTHPEWACTYLIVTCGACSDSICRKKICNYTTNPEMIVIQLVPKLFCVCATITIIEVRIQN